MGLFDFSDFGGFGPSSPSYFPQRREDQFQFQFPVGDFRQDAFASAMNPQQNYFPATSEFMSALGDRPTYEEYKPGVGRTIGAALAGLAASFNSPAAGAAVAGSIANSPYARAMGDYQSKIGGLRQAAGMEQNLAQFGRQMSQDQFERERFGRTAGLQERELEQKGELGRGALDVQREESQLKGRAFENQIQQQALDRALQEKKIGIDQYQAATQRLNAETNVGEAASRADYYKNLIRQKDEPGKANPSAALLEAQAGAAIQSNPRLMQYIDREGNINMRKLATDPQALQELQEIYRKVGLVR